MNLVRINKNPSRRDLTIFGLIWLVFYGVVGGIVWGKSGSTTAATVIWALAVGVPVVGWLVPSLMRVVYLGMCYVSYPIGLVVSHVILAIVYFLVITPIGLLMRMLGHDPMHRRFDPDAETYWIPREQPERIERYFRQS
ncbi:MAG TPA: SxtJ family membrane protein, partial [Thermoguttaceae bacterium]|nr:SxtJ family membrane protein [Thermoguttaceae bacterium]